MAIEINNQAGLDLATCNEAGLEGPSLSFLLNNGQASFLTQRPRQVGVQYSLHDLTAGDYSGDGFPDLAVAATDVVNVFPPQATVLVLRNNGRGGFAGVQDIPLTGLFPRCIVTGDVTGDAVLDLVVCHSVLIGETQDGRVSIIPGRPGGGFGAVVQHRVGTDPSALAIAFLDDDSRSDLVVADIDGRMVFVLYGNTGPTFFDAPLELARVPAPTAVGVTNIDPPSLPDVLVTSETTGQLLSYRQTSRRRFAMPTATAITQLPSDLGIADFDGDGLSDVVVTSFSNATVSLWYGDGRGGFELGEEVTVSDAPDVLIIDDLNGDSLLDVATSSRFNSTVSVLLQGADVPGSGDASCDGVLDDADLDALVEEIFFRTACASADVNFDGRVTAADVPLLVRLLAGS